MAEIIRLPSRKRPETRIAERARESRSALLELYLRIERLKLGPAEHEAREVREARRAVEEGNALMHEARDKYWHALAVLYGSSRST